MEAEVTIIGGGFTGVAIARELSKYKVDVVLVERGGELAAGASKATLGHIYTGLNMVGSMILKSVVLPPGTPLTVEALHDPKALITRWSEQGFDEWRTVLDELHVTHRDSHLLIVAKDDEHIMDLEKYLVLGRKAGGVYSDFRQIGRDEIFALEPNINKDVVTALYATNQIIDVFPPELVMAVAENATQNGTRILLNAEVTGIDRERHFQTVRTSNGSIKTRFIVNAAGGWADKVADMGGSRDWGLRFNKTQFMILDRRLNGLLNGTVRWPNKPGRIELVQTRADNILVECGTYDATDRPDDTASIREAILRGLEIGCSLLPAISRHDVIAAFTGVRTFNTRIPGDHIVEFPPDNPAFLNVIIRLPGIIGALPMARYAVSRLAAAGLELEPNEHFNPRRRAIKRIRTASFEERCRLAVDHPGFGRVICRCEEVTEGEILDAVERGARTIDGVKFRTRAGMGRCQGNFCSAKIASIVATQLQQPIEDMTKKGTGSRYASARREARAWVSGNEEDHA
ncbi:MAG: FAD-dependent oxidoreductase [Burkholderiales bacterium]|nr:FAD-dependent oxidoreductase [Burkholderiales bacterium]